MGFFGADGCLCDWIWLLDSNSVNGITVIKLRDNLDNHMVYVKREDVELSQVGEAFVAVMKEYFARKEKYET